MQTVSHSRLSTALFVLMLVAGAHTASATSFSVTLLDMPGHSGTDPQGINNAGDVIGNTFGQDAFFYSGGLFTTISEPRSGGTKVFGINDAGQVVGQTVGFNNFEWMNGVFTAILARPFEAFQRPMSCGSNENPPFICA